MELPIYSKLEAHYRKNRTSFAMPGHKNLRGLAPDLQKCDVTELASTVDLHHESDEVKRANELLAELYRSKQSFILTCGSTAGVQVMLSSVLKPGDTVLASADCHMSVINTCAVCGFRMKIMPVRYDEDYLIPTRNEDIELTPDIKAVIVTSPNYYGIVKNIQYLAKTCHDAGIPLLVDEAHGAHFIGSDAFPESATELGADMVCQSAHKTLNALTGAAYLHICSDRISIDRVRHSIAAFETSSPSYPIAASADIARAQLAKRQYMDITDECSRFREAIARASDIRVFDNDDITRIVLNFSEYEITGFKVSEMLSEHFGIDVEMADYLNIVLIATPWNKHSDFMALFSALRDITDIVPKRTEKPVLKLPPARAGIISPADGWYGDTERIALDEAQNRISADVITAYPPGTAIVITGEKITREQIEYIKLLEASGAALTGVQNSRIEVVK
ncbi:MAG: aminotransferase class V-fold PLP-dependent enzyme [Oscillospiraceae bacterium]|nr:aminotransferase class V-fold PLP-dependent enzyme [Oscillospiraceae bacterium]